MQFPNRINCLQNLWRPLASWALLLVIGLLLAGCKSPAPPPLPTSAVLASPPPATTPPAVALLPSMTSTVPPTYTPYLVLLPRVDDMRGNVSSVGPTETATRQAAFPTRTLRPPTVTSTSPPTATPLPTATPTRYVLRLPDMPPTDELGPSKLGVHVVRNNDPRVMEFVRNAQPAVVKAVDDTGFLEEVKAASPRTVAIARLGEDHQHYGEDPEQSARDFFFKQLDRYLLNPYVDYWEGWNEPDPNLDRMEWYARFESERIRLMAQYGMRAAIGGFPAGTPEFDEFLLFVPAIVVAKEHQAILTLHEGSAPEITYLYGEPLPGFPTYADRGAMAFRYRWWYRDILEPNDLVIPLVISELGVDGVALSGTRPGPNGFGWYDFADYWVDLGWGESGGEAFINQMAWYDAGVRQDGYVIGFCIFPAGPIGFWKNYDIGPLLPDMGNYINSTR